MRSTQNKQLASLAASTKELIERSAITLFSQKGYDATSMREIAAAAGVTKPVIYYYFKSKENMCHHLISSGLEDFRLQIRAVCENRVDANLEQLVRMVAVHFEFCKRNVEFVRFVYAVNFGPDREKIDYDFYAYGMDIFRMQERLMRRASRAGLLQSGKEEAAVNYLRGIINTFVMLYVDGRRELEPDLARTIVTDMLNGLGQQRPEPAKIESEQR